MCLDRRTSLHSPGSEQIGCFNDSACCRQDDCCSPCLRLKLSPISVYQAWSLTPLRVFLNPVFTLRCRSPPPYTSPPTWWRGAGSTSAGGQLVDILLMTAIISNPLLQPLDQLPPPHIWGDLTLGQWNTLTRAIIQTSYFIRRDWKFCNKIINSRTIPCADIQTSLISDENNKNTSTPLERAGLGMIRKVLRKHYCNCHSEYS